MKKFTILLLSGVLYALPSFAQDKKEPKATTAEPQREVFTYVEQMPEAGYDINQFIAKNVVYPKDAIKENVEGRVVLKFIVSETGAIENISVARSLYPSIDSEAVKILKNMPNWKPGRQNGKAVAVSFMLPMTFRLEDAKAGDKK